MADERADHGSRGSTSRRTSAAPASIPADIRMKMLVLHAPEALGLKQEYIKEHEGLGGH
jgi:hypothetical protein